MQVLTEPHGKYTEELNIPAFFRVFSVISVRDVCGSENAFTTGVRVYIYTRYL